MSKKVLKRCPFCGGEAEYKIFNDTCYENGWYSMVRCNKCGAIMQGEYDEAIDQWNNRNNTNTENLKLKRSDIENIIQIEWKEENSLIYADVFYLRLHYQKIKEHLYVVYAGLFYDNDSMLSFISKAESEDEAKQIAKKFVIDMICDALKIEE